AVSLVTSRLSQRVTTEERRSSLLSALSHDLRTPLAAITGAATTLRDESAAIDSGQRREMLDTICEEADRLERLVRNLLDMTRLESGALAVKRQWMPLEEVVGSGRTRLGSQAALGAGEVVSASSRPACPALFSPPICPWSPRTRCCWNRCSSTCSRTPPSTR